MSVNYQPILWNPFKKKYDKLLWGFILAFIVLSFILKQIISNGKYRHATDSHFWLIEFGVVAYYFEYWPALPHQSRLFTVTV
jgi:hypothetical protein